MNRETLSSVAEWLRSAKHAVAFTGAGISTESGIPDFRSPGGIWSKYRPVYFDEFMSDPDARFEYWRQKCEGFTEFEHAEPNVAHRVLAEWEADGFIRGVITQNIDGLHQLAGSREVLELHGTVRQVKCLDCETQFPSAPLVRQFIATQQVPICTCCGKGRLKHATISFGQMLPPDVLQTAFAWCRTSSMTFAIGSSLVVTPAADLPPVTKQHGGRLVIVNRDPTPLDSIADACLPDSIGETLAAINALLR